MLDLWRRSSQARLPPQRRPQVPEEQGQRQGLVVPDEYSMGTDVPRAQQATVAGMAPIPVEGERKRRRPATPEHVARGYDQRAEGLRQAHDLQGRRLTGLWRLQLGGRQSPQAAQDRVEEGAGRLQSPRGDLRDEHLQTSRDRRGNPGGPAHKEAD